MAVVCPWLLVVCVYYYSIDVLEMIVHAEFDIDANGVVSDEEAKVITRSRVGGWTVRVDHCLN